MRVWVDEMRISVQCGLAVRNGKRRILKLPDRAVVEYIEFQIRIAQAEAGYLELERVFK